jgi:hypothetical protein
LTVDMLFFDPDYEFFAIALIAEITRRSS